MKKKEGINYKKEVTYRGKGNRMKETGVKAKLILILPIIDLTLESLVCYA